MYGGMIEDIKLTKGLPVSWWERQVVMYRSIRNEYPNAITVGLKALAAAQRIEDWNERKEESK